MMLLNNTTRSIATSFLKLKGRSASSLKFRGCHQLFSLVCKTTGYIVFASLKSIAMFRSNDSIWKRLSREGDRVVVAHRDHINQKDPYGQADNYIHPLC